VSLVPTETKTSSVDNIFKEKRKLAKKTVVHWVWKPFRNVARTDGVSFHHWARIEESPEGNEKKGGRKQKKKKKKKKIWLRI
jgi:hypothetical protein